METCPCGTNRDYAECCGRLIDGGQAAATAEALMRSRYTAYAKSKFDYLRESLLPKTRDDFDLDSVSEWSTKSTWLGLEIVSTEAGSIADDHGVVEFIARYRRDEEVVEHRESAEFRKEDGRWYFVSGKVQGPDPFVREGAKVGRNDPCPCGSGKKYKKCCA